jgi:hypothetical protein
MANLQTAQVANYDFGATAAAIVFAVAATATATFAGQPTSGNILVLGTLVGAITYQFTNSAPSPGYVAVAIGANADATATNLAAAINAQNALNNQGATAVAAANVVTITDDTPGTGGNSDTLSTNDGNIAVTPFAGGVANSTSVGLLVFSVGEAAYNYGGGKAELHFECPINGPNGIGIRPVTNPLTITVQVSPDGVNWANTTAPNNITAIVGYVLGPGQDIDFAVAFRAGTDKFFRVNAQGPGRGLLQIRSQQSVKIDIVEI